MFANCQLMGLDLAFPDICKTPPALIPIPYPNLALGPMGIPNAWNILLMGMPAHNLLTIIPLSNGDNPGLALGLISPSVMGPSRHITCVPNVLFKCIPATRLTSLAVQNRANALGMRIVPSQIKVVLLGGGGGGGAGAAGRGAGAAGRGGAGAGRGGSTARIAQTGRNARQGAGKGGSSGGRGGMGSGGRGGGPGRGGRGGGSGKGGKGSARNQYMGRTPGKNSRTGREVQNRMRNEGTLRDNKVTGKPEFQATNGRWYPLDKADMAHRTDAVRWWNSTGYQYGARAPEVRRWMLDPKNYRLDHYSLNRSAGARIGQTYRPPAP